MSEYKKLSHVIYKCEYHIVWVPEYRFRILTVGIDEDVIKRYLKHQEKEERQMEEQQHRFDF
ncbi:MAG: hypothetical protein GY790_01390 [Bacteroidetes bacterium]|nr:hypothetical protein [Bacteroidota bacterium]